MACAAQRLDHVELPKAEDLRLFVVEARTIGWVGARDANGERAIGLPCRSDGVVMGARSFAMRVRG
eukprot:scaffold150380_cov28-Tisochrysis_lutea.AAC.3